ncbi:MAG: sugar transferase [Jannaschia sp.]
MNTFSQLADPALSPWFGQRLYERRGKRALDFLAILLLLPIILPLVLILGAFVMLDGRGPFYSQMRVGRSGREFRMWKLRTMVPDADARLASALDICPATRAEWDRDQKLADDPRITPLGRFLRRTSLDELPQLLNVMLGDMSLVGPRPMLPSQRDIYPGHAYYRLRPGLTGSWQISDRNRTPFAARAEFDLAYERALSAGLDLRILLATTGVVLRATGR